MRRMIHGVAVVALLVALCGSATDAFAQVNAGVLFLRIAPGARAAGMGEAYVAVSDDAMASHWNPAGLGVYPLNTEWSEWNLNLQSPIVEAVTLSNGLGGEDFNGYDLWILTDDGLATYQLGNDAGATRYARVSTAGVRSLDAAVRRYVRFLSESEAEDISRRAAANRAGIPPDQLEAAINRVMGAMPDGYTDRSIVEGIIRDLRVAHREGRIDIGRFRDLEWEISQLPETGSADVTQLDRIRVMMEHSVTTTLPSSANVAFADIARLPITDIESDGDNLFVAAANGLLVYDSKTKQWDEVDTPDGVDWTTEGIHCLAIAPGRRLWVGTNDKIYVRHSGSWSTYTTADGLPAGAIQQMLPYGSRFGWVLTEGGLARFDGERFSAAELVVANVDDDLLGMMKRYTSSEDEVYLNQLVARLRERNGLASDYVPEAGRPVSIPFDLGYRGRITALGVDSYGALWVGTDLGAFRHSNERWRSYGYRAVTTTEATTVTEMAEAHLGARSTPDRVAALADYIRRYNNLSGDQVEAGRTVYLYRNPAGSPILAFGVQGDMSLVASSSGLLQFDNGRWDRYYHAELERDQVKSIHGTGRDVWMVTDSRLVVYKHPYAEVSLVHTPWLPEFNLDLYYEYATLAKNLQGIGSLAFSAKILSYGEIPRLDEFGNVLNLFHSFDFAFSVSYGTRLSRNMTAGLTAKLIYSRLADQGAGAEIGSGSATAFAMDAGLLYRTPWRRLTLGAAVTNVGPNISYIDAQQSDPLPRNLGVGLAYNLLDSRYNRLTLAADLNKELVDLSSGNEFNQIIYNLGMEYSYASTVAIRVGYVHDDDGEIKVPTVGFGLKYQIFRLDVAYIPASRDDTPLANTLRSNPSARFRW